MIEINVNELVHAFWQVMLWSWAIMMPIRIYEWLSRRNYRNIFSDFLPEALFVFTLAPYLLIRWVGMFVGSSQPSPELFRYVSGQVALLLDDDGSLTYGFFLSYLSIDNEHLHGILVHSNPVTSVFIATKMEMLEYCVDHYPRVTRLMTTVY